MEPTRTIRVLNVDDTEAVRYARTRYFARAGYEVIESGAGDEAVRLTLELHPQLVVLDVKLPGIDGYEACRRIKAASPTTMVLQISGTYLSSQARVAALDAGADAYLTDPVEPDVLLATAKALLRLQYAVERLQQEVERREIADVEHDRLEGELRTSELRREMVYQAAGVGSAEWLPETGEISVTDSFRSMFGLPGTDGVRIEEWMSRVHPKDAQKAEALCRIAACDGFADGEYRLLKDGEIRWVRTVARKVGGEAAGGRVVIVSVDITAPKQAEERVRESEERFRLASSAVTGVVYEQDLLSGHVYRSEGLRELVGVPVDKAPASRGWWFDRINPEDLATARQTLQRALESGADRHAAEYRVRHEDGRWIHVWDRARIVRDEAGRAIKMIGHTMDVTERVRAEQRERESANSLRRLVDSNIVGIAIANLNGVTYANDLFLQLAGASREDLEAGTIDWVKITPPEQLELDYRGIKELRERGTCAPYEKEYVHADGTRVPLLIGAATLSQDPLEWICFTVDLTEQKRLQKELEAANQDLQQFAYAISHDLQEPLRTVSTYVELLARRYREALEGDAGELTHHIVDATGRMRRMITDLLTYSRVGTHETRVPVDTAQIVNYALSNVQTAIEESQAEIVSGELPPVSGDFGRLAQLFQNLVGNAIKYRGEDPPRIEITGERLGDRCVFHIRDNGIGFEPHQAERIFGVFKRLHPVGEYPGTGIGLAIARRIVESHGGRIWAESSPGKGSTFSFSLPAAAAPNVSATS